MKKNNFKNRRGRLVTVGKTKWKYFVGRQNVIAYSETGERRCETIWDIKGITYNDFEKGQWKKNRDGMVLPQEVCDWLSKKNKKINKPKPRQKYKAPDIDYNEYSSSYGYGGWGHDE